MNRRSSPTTQHLTGQQGDMTPTEWAVLRDVATTRLATAGQLEMLQALREPMHARSFRRLLERLNAQRTLFRLDRVIGGRRAGSSGYVYGVDSGGQRLLNLSPRRPWTPRPSWLAHALQTTQLYVELKQEEALGNLVLAGFQAEPESWRNYEAPGGGIVALKPDAFVELEHDDFLDRFFIETDMATEAPATLRSKAKAYTAYLNSGAEQANGDVFPFVTWLTTNKARASVIADAVVSDDQTRSLHRVGTFDRAVETLLDDPP